MIAKLSDTGSIVIEAENLAEYHALRKLFPFGQHKDAHLECTMGSTMLLSQTIQRYTIHIHPVSPHSLDRPPSPSV